MTFKDELQAIIDDLAANLTAGVTLRDQLTVNADGIWQIPDGDQVVIDIAGLTPTTDSGGTYWAVTLAIACISSTSVEATSLVTALATRMETHDFKPSGHARLIQPDVQYTQRGFEIEFVSSVSFDTFA